jgi:hypothetical protein
MTHMIRAMVVLLFLVAEAAAVRAQSAPEHLVTLNTRTFNLGIDVSKMRRDPDFIPMNDIDWLSPILDVDPVLGPTVFHLRAANRSNKSTSYLWEHVGNNAHDFPYTQNIPDRFLVTGYQVWSNNEDGRGSILLIPTDPDADYAIRCDQDRKSGEVVYCHFRASYPPDPLIYLQARHYNPRDWDKTREELDDIVARMREIAACLDVTDRQLELEPNGLPKLAGCETGAGM